VNGPTVAARHPEVPFGKGKTYLTEGPASHILGGWRISGVTNLRSGRPLTIFAGANNSLVGNRGGLANALADCVSDGALPTDERNVDRWFDASGYSVPTPARLGNCGRNTLDGPGLVNFDFALARVLRRRPPPRVPLGDVQHVQHSPV